MNDASLVPVGKVEAVAKAFNETPPQGQGSRPPP